MRPRGSWERQFNTDVGPKLELLFTAAQVAVVREADRYVAEVLAELGIVPDALPGVVNPAGLAGVAGDGLPVASLIGGAVLRAGEAYRVEPAAGAAGAATALASGGSWVEGIGESLLTDTARASTLSAMVARPEVGGYIRMIEAGACSRCAVMAGKFYRWNTGFERHPRCRCVHIPAREEGVRFGSAETNPNLYFDSLPSAAELDARYPDLTVAMRRAGGLRSQEDVFTKAGAGAIRNGADISQVVNARRGMRTAQIYGHDLLTTTTGTTGRGMFGHLEAQRGGPTAARNVGRRGYVANYIERRATRPRLMPESIVKLADGDRDEAVRLLRSNGYILPTSKTARTASAAGGGKKPPSRAVAGGLGEPPDENDKAAWLAYWKGRRDATGLDFKGDDPQPHEVEFVERFLRRGEQIEWIPRSPGTATSDVIWRGAEFELKSTKARAQTIHGRIVDASSRAMRNHGVVKENFIVDIGAAVLTSGLRDELARFNLGRRKYRVSQMWVLSEDGRHLTQISLET